MTTTLSEGVKVPDVGSVNWAGDLEVNWNLLNGALANLSGNVKTDRDNTWTGEQSFTLPIIGSITGTASKAIADEDGTSIKTGYVNVAGNQTVTGQKTWGGNQFYTAGAYHRNNSYEIGNTPVSNVAIPIYFTDKINAHTGYVRNVILTTGKTQSELLARNKFTNGALNPTGTDVSSTLQVEVQSNGDKTLYFDGSIRNNVLPYTTNTYSLGSSSYQWSSVYAQTYYDNGTAWGLDKANTWTKAQIIEQSTIAQFKLKNSTMSLGDAVPSGLKTVGSVAFAGSDNYNFGFMDFRDSAQGNTFIRILARQKYDANGNRSTSGTTYESGIDIGVLKDTTPYVVPTSNAAIQLGTSANQWKSVYSQTYYYNGTAWGLDKANVWTGANTFTSTITTKTNVDRMVAPASDSTYGTIICRDKNGSAMFRMQGTIKTDLSNVWDMMMVAPNNSYITFFRYSINTATSDRELRFKADSVIPDDNSTSNLGTSTNKWKTLNGINPGALSLPDFTSETGVSLSAGANTYTPVLSGWLSISTTGDISVVCGNFCHKATDMISVPVIAGKTYTVTMPSAATGYFYSCLGNV